MKARGLLVVGALCGAAALAIPRAVRFLHTAVAKANSGEPPGVEARVHTREEFAFTAKGTIEQVAPYHVASVRRHFIDQLGSLELTALTGAYEPLLAELLLTRERD